MDRLSVLITHLLAMGYALETDVVTAMTLLNTTTHSLVDQSMDNTVHLIFSLSCF
jgi:hypothetical protein